MKKILVILMLLAVMGAALPQGIPWTKAGYCSLGYEQRKALVTNWLIGVDNSLRITAQYVPDLWDNVYFYVDTVVLWRLDNINQTMIRSDNYFFSESTGHYVNLSKGLRDTLIPEFEACLDRVHKKYMWKNSTGWAYEESE
jgi:hypothetical protein